MFIDYSIDYINKPNSLKISLIYTGSDALFLGFTFVLYLILLIIIELYYYSFSEVEDGLIDQNGYKNLDKNVQIEIDKANGKDIENKNEKQNEENLEENRMYNNKIILNDFNYFDDMNSVEKINYQLNEDKSRNKNNQIFVYNSGNELGYNENQEGNYKNINKNDYAVKIKNMQKVYNNNCCSPPTIGVKNISFTVNYGECFGLLGLNGAGKTTIFKAITEEHAPSHGSIYINGLNLIKNFDEVKLMFGYCPQFDAIFSYMTVYENLEFYSKIKGVAPQKLSEIIKAMIEAMTLRKQIN